MKTTRILTLITGASLVLASCMVTAPLVDDAHYAIPDDYPANSVDAETAARYGSLLSEATRGGYPGFAMLIDGPDGFWAGAGGLADIANDVPMRKNNLFKIGSVTKVFTAALILDLEEDGLLSIQDLISAHLPEDMVRRIPNGSEATIIQLLNHTSGIPNYFGFSLLGLDYATDHLNHLTDFNLSKETLVSYIYDRSADFPPGEDWAYSNTNYVLLALIAENLTDQSYPELLGERIFVPLGLDNTSFETEIPPQGLVRGYDAFFGDNVLYDVSADISGLGGDGGIISNTYDIAKFFRSLFNLELFPQEQLDKMLTQYPYNSWGSEPTHTSGYALGLFFEAADGVADYYAHYGYVYGFGSDAYYFIQADTMVVYLTNMTNNPAAGEKTGPLHDLLWSFLDPL
jgi:D-alanyl-D-alanine carboxypeptidase